MEKYTEEQRKQFLEEMRGSGLSVSAFCKKKGIKVSTFSYWRKHARQKEKASEFIQIPQKLYHETTTGAEYTITSGALKVHIPADTAINEIEALFSIIWKLSC